MRTYKAVDLMSTADGGIEVWGLGIKPRQGLPYVGDKVVIRGKVKKVLDVDTDYESQYATLTVKQAKIVENKVKEENSEVYSLKDAILKSGGRKIRRWNGGDWVDPTIDDISITDAVSDDWIIEIKQTFPRHDLLSGLSAALEKYADGCSKEEAFKEGVRVAEESGLGEACDEDQTLD